MQKTLRLAPPRISIKCPHPRSTGQYFQTCSCEQVAMIQLYQTKYTYELLDQQHRHKMVYVIILGTMMFCRSFHQVYSFHNIIKVIIVMNEPRTLQEYIQMRNLQRKRENCLINQAKNFPNPLSLDKQKKIDQLMMQIFDYIKHVIGEGPIFHRFRTMMENLYKTFQRQLTQFHNVGLVNKFKTDQRYIDDMKKANLKLNEYLHKCEDENKETDKKLEKLQKDNKDLNNNMIFINRGGSKKVEIEDNFEDEEVVERTQKIGKITRIEPEDNSKKKNGHEKALMFPNSKTESIKQPNIRVIKPLQTKEPLKQQKPITKIASFFNKI